METNEIRVKSDMPLGKAIDYLQAVINSLRENQVCVQHGDEALTLKPPADITVQVKARRKEEKESISIKVSWRARSEVAEAGPELSISSVPTAASCGSETPGTPEEA